MAWFRFWKKSGSAQIYSEDFFEFSDEEYETDEHIKEYCAHWAKTRSGGLNTHYSCGYKEVLSPPVKWLKEKIQKIQIDVDFKTKRIERYQKILSRAERKIT